jgi:hypothetical protein
MTAQMDVIENKERTIKRNQFFQDDCEYAYTEGIKDFFKGKIVVQDWKWTGSPWDDGSIPIYEGE